jgi:hypothetical protein
MLAGVWVLLLLPLMDVLKALGWASNISVPTVVHRWGILTLDETLVSLSDVYQPLIFCIGIVLLFSNERERRRGPLDWTRRWGVLCSYVVLLLSAAPVLFIISLVMVGISALFMSMPLRYQPGVTPLFIDVSTAYLRYGPQPKNFAGVVVVAFSSIAILLACVPLFDALRSSGPKRFALILLAPLALFSLMHLGQVGEYCLTYSRATSADVFLYRAYFWPQPLVNQFAYFPMFHFVSASALGDFVVEATKWCIVLAIAIWLTIAQVAAGWRRRRIRAG